MRLVASLIAIAALSACNQPTTQAPDTPAPTPQIAACNALEPDSARLVTVQDEAAVTMLADLRGGAITPGLYDLPAPCASAKPPAGAASGRWRWR